jgi:hypothetical protein
MRTPDDGLAAVAYGPCSIQTDVRGVKVKVEVQTGYPFDGTIAIVVRTDGPVRFPLKLRVPAWAEGARLHETDHEPIQLTPGTFAVLECNWQDETRLMLDFPLAIRAERRFNDAVSLSRGPLLLGLQMGEAWRQIGGTPPAADWEIFPTTPWAYALDLNPATPERSLRVERRLIVGGPFSRDSTPLVVHARGRQVPGWTLERGAAAPPPPSPVHSDQPIEPLTLLPYGATGLRLGELPVLDSSAGEAV